MYNQALKIQAAATPNKDWSSLDLPFYLVLDRRKNVCRFCCFRKDPLQQCLLDVDTPHPISSPGRRDMPGFPAGGNTHCWDRQWMGRLLNMQGHIPVYLTGTTAQPVGCPVSQQLQYSSGPRRTGCQPAGGSSFWLPGRRDHHFEHTHIQTWGMLVLNLCHLTGAPPAPKSELQLMCFTTYLV